MTGKEKRADILMRFEIVVAAILFFVMLVCCGLYIDVKMNGKTSNLPTLSETDTRLLLSSSELKTKEVKDDLLEPVFIGFKNNGEMLGCVPGNEQTGLLQNALFEEVNTLFKGEDEFVVSDGEENGLNIESIKNSEQYVLISFYDDLPSDVILPCISESFDFNTGFDGFFFRHLFIVPDDEGNISAYAVSSQNDITLIKPYEKRKFNNFFDETYDITDGKIHFVFDKEGSVSPVFTSSFEVCGVETLPYAKRFGMDVEAEWLGRLFDAFSLNPNIVKSFSSGDGSEINYIEDFRELVVNIDGSVEYKDTDGVGVGLDEFVGYLSLDSSEYSFSDKVLALKNLINTVYGNSGNVSYSLVGIDYVESTDSLKFYFKYTTNGIFVFENDYDAVFEIKDNKLVYAYMLLFECIPNGNTGVTLPQRYASVISGNNGGEVFPVYVDSNGDGALEFFWASLNEAPEVTG